MNSGPNCDSLEEQAREAARLSTPYPVRRNKLSRFCAISLLASGLSVAVGASMPCAAQAAPPPSAPPATQAAPPSSVPAAPGTTPDTVNTSSPGAAQTAAQAAPAGAPAPGAAVDNSTYVIGPQDVLQITVWREPTLTGAIPVRPDGMISMVLLGDLPAAGRTPMQLGSDIATKLKKFIQDPSVSVLVTGVNSQRIFMIGEVGRPGPIVMTANMTPLQAISTAGGLTTFANSKHIYILRGDPGKQQKIPFNYKQALKGDSKEAISLQPGDTIVVP